MIPERRGEVVLDSSPRGQRHPTIRHRIREIGAHGKDVARVGIGVGIRETLHVRRDIRSHRVAAGLDVFDQMILVADRRIRRRGGKHVPHRVDDVARAPARVDPIERGDDRVAVVRVGRVEPLDQQSAALAERAVLLVHRDAVRRVGKQGHAGIAALRADGLRARYREQRDCQPSTGRDRCPLHAPASVGQNTPMLKVLLSAPVTPAALTTSV